MAGNTKLITPEIFQFGMNKLLTHCKEPLANNADIYHSIYEATLFMCAVLRQLGYKEGIKIFEELCMAPKPEKPKKCIVSLN